MILLLFLPVAAAASELEWIEVAAADGSFVLQTSGRKFIPWGFNYDHQEDSGRLIEDYWDKEWATVEEDFREMKRLGANVVRVHLITVGLVPWSLDRPGLTSGFIPEKVSGSLDFIAVHIYPEKGRWDEAIKTLRGFAEVGKPVVIEEIFPLKCSADELSRFIDESRKDATGWIGFYWGKTPGEYHPTTTIRDAIVLSWLELFQEKGQLIRPQ